MSDMYTYRPRPWSSQKDFGGGWWCVVDADGQLIVSGLSEELAHLIARAPDSAAAAAEIERLREERDSWKAIAEAWNINDIEQACRLLRLWASDRQRTTGKWTGQEQAGVDCAIRLAESARAANEGRMG